MAQNTVFGAVDVHALIKVNKANGTTQYYRVVGDQNIPISEEQYRKEGGQ